MGYLRRLDALPSFEDSLEFANCACEAFRTDLISVYMCLPRFRFVGLQREFASIKDPRERLDEIIMRAKAWKANVMSYAWFWYGRLAEPGTRAWLWYNDADIPVGCASWTIPAEFREHYSLLQSVKIGVRRLWASLRYKIYVYRNGCNARLTKQYASFFAAVEDELGFNNTPQRLKELFSMTPEKRLETGFTSETAFDLIMFAVSEQNKGHGHSFFEQVLAEILIEARKSPSVTRSMPPKLSIVSSPAGKKLYKKFNFRTVAVAHRTIEGCTEEYVRDLMTLDPF